MAQGLLSKLAAFDGYGKTLEDFRVRTHTGALVTIITSAIIGILAISEFAAWVTPQWQADLLVDTRPAQPLRLEFDIILHHLPCFMTSLDFLDASGETHSDMDHDVYKIRIKRDGTPLAEQGLEKSEVGSRANKPEQVITEPSSQKECGDCYGGVPPESGCCNTCKSVRLAYQRKGWAFNDGASIAQCIKEGYVNSIKTQRNEGCRVRGTINTPRINGRFHIAPGRSFDYGNRHVLDLTSFEDVDWDFTHKIEKLRFFGQGEETQVPDHFLDGKAYPLEGFHLQIRPDGNQHVQNFIKIVSTRRQFLNGTEVWSSIYAASHYQEPETEVERTNRIPGLIFDFDVSPMLLTHQETRKPLATFLTDLCAIVGGVLTVAGVVDGILFKADRLIRQKGRLGKLQ